MKFEIETYKGQLIEYDDEYDKFICDISIEDKWKKTKRLSLVEVRKEIDVFIKLNADFKPFKALELDYYDRKSFKEVHVLSIRSDGKFVVQNTNSTSKSYYGKKQMKLIMVYDYDAVSKKERRDKEVEELISKKRNEISEICKTLIPVDLSKYEHIINPGE